MRRHNVTTSVIGHGLRVAFASYATN